MRIVSRSIHLFCCFSLSWFSFAQVQDALETRSNIDKLSIKIFLQDTTIQLPNRFIVQGSDSVWIDSIKLQRHNDYLIDYSNGKVSLRGFRLRTLINDTINLHRLIIRYAFLPFNFKSDYRHRAPVILKDTTTGEVQKVYKPTSAFSIDEVFGSHLQKSGSIVRGLTLGSNRDLTLTSGFRMQMEGNISDNVEVVAALTDENTPIQPEGTTQTLQEFDKVFVEIRGTDLAATLGDFTLDMSGNEFGRLSRKLQGAKGTASYRTGFTRGDVMLAGAITRGKFTTNQFLGVEGIQGPYRLVGRNNERDIIVIAGTERVYVNGIQMTRGTLNDYTIDYASGEVTFTTNRLITSASRITVDFEYTDRQFTRNLLAASGGSKFFDDKFSLRASFIRESDDKDSPIDVSLSDSDKMILANAGDNRFGAARTSIENVGPGKGQYVRIDTVFVTGSDSIPYTFYRFQPEDSVNATYAVSFTYVGSGKGDYNKIAIGRYQFVGIKKGSYAPVKFLPLPQDHFLTDIDSKIEISNDFSLQTEYALSRFDANRFSERDDGDNAGSAVNVKLQYAPKNITIGGTTLGSLDLGLRERFVNKNFVSIDRINDVEFNRRWNILDTSKADEEITEGTLMYFPLSQLRFDGGIGRMKRGEFFLSNRYTAGVHLSGEKLPTLDYSFEGIGSTDSPRDNKGIWTRHFGNAAFAIGAVVPGIRFEQETRKEITASADTLTQESFRFNEVAPRIEVNNVASMSMKAEVGWRLDDSLNTGSLQRAAKTFTQRYGWTLHEWNTLSSSFDVTLRERTYSEIFKLRSNQDTKTILVRSQSRFSPFNRGIESDLYYEVTSQRTAKIERVFQKVPKGQGNYVYLGDVNRNYTIDEPDFQPVRFDGDFVSVLVPSDQYIPITDLKTSIRVRLTGNRLISGSSWLHTVFSSLSTETYARVEEKSTEPETKKIYLLHFSRFLNDKTTLNGSNLFTQDLYVLENNPDISFRLRFSQRRGLTKFTLQDEKTYSRERSLRVRWHLVKEIANQTDYIHKNDNLSSSQFSNRVRQVVSNTVLTDWSYRPYQNIEIGFAFSVGTATNFDSVTASLNTQSVRLIYSFEEKGQARGEFSREEVSVNRSSLVLPYELTGGRIEGKTWLWKFSFDYRITQFLQSTVSYDGRIEGKNNAIHTGRAEVRAFF